ncbi:MAG: hypothetical protein ABJD07_09470 [Gemmatimonadaceae bacterium]
MAKRMVTTRRIPARQAIGCTAADLHAKPSVNGDQLPPAARVVVSRAGVPWLVSLVARVASEDVETGAVSGRLILRFESMSRPGHATRILNVRALSLDDLDDDALRESLSSRKVRALARG